MYSQLHLICWLTALLCLQQVSAVTLNDFVPRIDDLTGNCETVYKSSIEGCTSSDFENQECSTECISALRSIGVTVRQSCQGQGKSGTIIAAFLDGSGTNKLCPNAVSVKVDATSAASSTTLTRIGSSTMVLSETSVSATGIIVDTPSIKSSSPTLVTFVSTATITPVGISTTSTVTGSSLAFDTSTPSSIVEVPTATALSSSSKTHSAKETKTSNGDAGGSPFDSSSAGATAAASKITLLCGFLLCLFAFCC